VLPPDHPGELVDTLAVDGVGMGFGAVGLLNPLLAASIHVSSELAQFGALAAPRLPDVQPTKFHLMINVKTAKDIGLTIPPSNLKTSSAVVTS
jgi:hypothetical protein